MLLTNEEYEEAKNTLHDTTLARQLTANKRKQLCKRLKDYEYSVKYLPFKPTNYTIKHINKTTEIPDLEKYILDSKNATRFFIDTESTIKPYHPNEPALIQIMILRKDQSSIVLLVEVRHLPHQESQEFESIQELFRVIFQPKSLIHIWGNRDELKSFVKYQLLTSQQISSLNVRNEQGEFKTYWLQIHPHDDNNSSCICEYCINKEPNDPWSLTDAIAYVEQRWLDKSWTISPFSIGFDEKLYEQSPQQKAYRKKLSLYAAGVSTSLSPSTGLIMVIIGIQDQSKQQRYHQLMIDDNWFSTVHFDRLFFSTNPPRPRASPIVNRPYIRPQHFHESTSRTHQNLSSTDCRDRSYHNSTIPTDYLQHSSNSSSQT
ncbi:unnamed protein product, partial [Didymodactylos carnosus]